MMRTAPELPEETLRQWQDAVDLVVRLAGVRAGLVMRTVDDDIEVLVRGETPGNPYHVGERERLDGSGLYCETVLRSQEKLLVSNALESQRWRSNPDVRHGLISYLGFPIRLPDGRPFGTICLLDDRENSYSRDVEMVLEKMRDLIEGHLRLLADNSRQRLFASESLLRRILDNVPTSVACCSADSEGRLFYLNEQFMRTFGYTQADLPTMDRWFELVYPDDAYRAIRRASWRATLEGLLQQKGAAERKEFQVTCKDGRVLDVLIGAVVIEDMVLASFVDVTEGKRHEREIVQAHEALVAANAELGRLATTDPLTGAANRRHFDETLALQVEQARRYGEPLSLVLLDLDHFKAINDEYGHARGDEVLSEVSHRLQESLRVTDRLARWGGEEFAALLPHCDAAAALATAEKLRAVVSAPSPSGAWTVTASFGVAQLRPGEGPEELMKRADAALYDAKAAGRNAVRAR
ncbi:MAG: diguanylate cyclase [Holophagales bacterium]|jgi:diguanylate cyclase (GGDEF)-like protein/PAS domain S-box-containing protein|nr:diguanylate cyclase [Holophagales bacterium]MBK9964857.1 diguanylate cyclase [Holophagales bacterium]